MLQTNEPKVSPQEYHVSNKHGIFCCQFEHMIVTKKKDNYNFRFSTLLIGQLDHSKNTVTLSRECSLPIQRHNGTRNLTATIVEKGRLRAVVRWSLAREGNPRGVR